MCSKMKKKKRKTTNKKKFFFENKNSIDVIFCASQKKQNVLKVLEEYTNFK